MDDFLTKIYHEELEKNASSQQAELFQALGVTDLEDLLGLKKVAVSGPVLPDLSPAMKKSIEARETKGKDAEKRIASANSKTETQPERNIEPLTPGQSVPERNFVQPGRSTPENTLVVKQAAVQWADQMGRNLAHAASEGRLPFVKEAGDLSQSQRNALPSKSFAVPESKAKKLGVAGEIQGEAKGKYPIPDEAHARNALARVAQHGTPGEREAVKAKVHAKFPGIGEGEEKDSAAMCKAAAVQRGIKLASQLPVELFPAVISATARGLNKLASEKHVTPESWWAGQKGISRSMRAPGSTGIGKALADPQLVGNRVLHGLKHGLVGAGIGAGGGAAIGAGVGGKKKALLGALLGMGIGGLSGQTHGMYKADKEWLAKKGITPTMLGLGRGKFTPEAAKKYLKD